MKWQVVDGKLNRSTFFSYARSQQIVKVVTGGGKKGSTTDFIDPTQSYAPSSAEADVWFTYQVSHTFQGCPLHRRESLSHALLERRA